MDCMDSFHDVRDIIDTCEFWTQMTGRDDQLMPTQDSLFRIWKENSELIQLMLTHTSAFF